MVKFVAASLLIAAASANPLYKRQSASADALSTTASEFSASASAILSSGLASASAISSGSAVPSASAMSTNPAYPCTNGDLTYVNVMQAYPGVTLAQAVGFLENWSMAVPYPIVNSTGTNMTGATRTYTVEGLNISEVLTNQTINPTTGTLSSSWNLTTPISSAGLTIYSAAEHLDYYSNSTTGVSTANYYVNFCASNQTTGVAAFTALIQGTLTAIGAALSASGASSAMSGSSMAGAAAGGVPASSSAPASVVSSLSSAASSAASALSSATSSA